MSDYEDYNGPETAHVNRAKTRLPTAQIRENLYYLLALL